MNGYEKINWLTHPTGDPFADVGGLVIECLQEKFPDKDIFQLIEQVTDIYVSHWENNLHSFFLNSTITHNSNKGKKGVEKTISFYKGLSKEGAREVGYCRITGQYGSVFQGARDNHIMSGSATLINFHHGFENGIRLSKEALIRIFFVPLGVEQLGNKVAMVLSNNLEVTRYFVGRRVQNNLNDIGKKVSKSVLRSEFTNPANALFDYARMCIEDVQTVLHTSQDLENNAGTSLNLYHFTNFGASPTIDLYTLPATVFSFYAACMSRYRRDWQNFIYRQYTNSKFKNASFDPASFSWANDKESYNYDEFKTWKNRVLEALLNDNHKIVRKAFLFHSKRHILNFEIVKIYQTNIRNMDKRTISKIKELSDFMVIDRSDDDIKKFIARLNGAKNGNVLRGLLLKLMDRNYQEGNKEPLFSLEEYVDYLFPDGSYWAEIRDLLLIAMYQRLHEIDKKVAVELEEPENEQLH